VRKYPEKGLPCAGLMGKDSSLERETGIEHATLCLGSIAVGPKGFTRVPAIYP
jgi:hypothetical protein